MSMADDRDRLDEEIEIIQASLLPTENLAVVGEYPGPRILDITSTDSALALRVTVGSAYPNVKCLNIDVRGNHVGREEAEGWASFVEEKMREWDPEEDYPLFQLMTTHFIPLLAPTSPSPPSSPTSAKGGQQTVDDRPYQALMTSHHLLSPTKKKNLFALSSQLSLTGFSKTGHPGIMYAIGSKSDLEEWIREAKSWQWLALRVRITPEPFDDGDTDDLGGKGKKDGARGGKGRGDWVELEKIGEALDWLKGRGKEHILTDFGIGSA